MSYSLHLKMANRLEFVSSNCGTDGGKVKGRAVGNTFQCEVMMSTDRLYSLLEAEICVLL